MWCTSQFTHRIKNSFDHYYHFNGYFQSNFNHTSHFFITCHTVLKSVTKNFPFIMPKMRKIDENMSTFAFCFLTMDAKQCP